jgi:monofunctional biosynthetic peptidoglycan transglycosylase
VITVMIEMLWDKRRILEVYLNVVEWGDGGLFGAEAAARHYFRTTAAALAPEQAARLAVLLPGPRKYGRNPYSPYLEGRTQSVLARMQYSEVP